MKKALLKSAATVGSGTFLSRILGFVREVLMAQFFGTELAKSAFDVAFKIPNLFRRLFGEGALSAAFVPVFSEVREQEGLEEASRLGGRVATMLAVFLCIVVGLIWLGALLLESWDGIGARGAAVLPLLRIMLPYTVFICLVALVMGILNSVGHYATPAYTPVVLNVVWIAVLLIVCPGLSGDLFGGVRILAWSILAAGALQLAVQVPVLRKHRIRLRPDFAWRDKRISRMLILMGPAALGLGIHQVNVVIDSLLALWVGSWAPAALTYAERLVYLPLGLIATAFGTVLLPTYSRQAAKQATDSICETLRFSMQSVLFLMIPAAVGLCVLAGPITELVYQWSGGRFDQRSVTLTARALAFYAPGLVVFSVYKVLVPAFYALKDTATPVRVGIWAVLINFGLNVVFVLTWPTEYRHAGLACATVIASGVNCLALGVLLQKKIGNPGWDTMFRGTLKALIPSVATGFTAWAACAGAASLCEAAGMTGKAAQCVSVFSGIGLAMLVYAAVAVFLNRGQLKSLLASRKRR